MLRATGVERARERPAPGREVPLDLVHLAHDERHLRRKAITLDGGERVLVDLPDPVTLEHGDRLMLEDGRHVEVAAAEEELLEIVPRDRQHLAELCWHIGNRHLAAQVEAGRVLILRDHVIRDMLVGLGATVSDAVEPFHPVRGAYSGHSHGHHHHRDGHAHHHDH